jgi:hypothetical protein
MATLQQIRKIHTLKNLLNMSDKTYRKFLASFDVGSSKFLTETEAGVLISIFDAKVKRLNLKKYDELKGRDESMATPMQLRKLEAVWGNICRNKDKTHRARALRKYLSMHFHINDIRFLTKERAGKIIGIIERKIMKSMLKTI